MCRLSRSWDDGTICLLFLSFSLSLGTFEQIGSGGMDRADRDEGEREMNTIKM